MNTRPVVMSDEAIQALIAGHQTDEQDVIALEKELLAETRCGLVDSEHVPVRF